MTTAIHVYGDPLDPRGWGSEPGLRRLRTALPDAEWTFHPVVLVPDWEQYDGPEFRGRGAVPAACSRVSEDSGMPIDEFLWFDDPPASSAPATHGVAAAFEQGEQAGWRLLRAAREATFIRRRNLDSEGAVAALAAETPGVDADAIEARLDEGVTLDSPDIESVSGVDWAGDRPQLPTVVVRGGESERGHSGVADFPQLSHLVSAASGEPPEAPSLTVDAAIERYSGEGWLAVTELSALSGAGYDAATTTARELDGVVERSFASEPFFRTASAIPDDAGGES